MKQLAVAAGPCALPQRFRHQLEGLCTRTRNIVRSGGALKTSAQHFHVHRCKSPLSGFSGPFHGMHLWFP